MTSHYLDLFKDWKATAASAAVFATAVVAGELYHRSAFPASVGIEYLESKGYTQVEGGKRTYLSGCFTRGASSRTYSGITPEGEVSNKISVCHNLFGNLSQPLIKL